MKHFLLIAVLLFFSSNTFAQTLEDDRLALIAIYNATDGDRWISSQDIRWPVWGSPGDDPCEWKGVGCANGRVTMVMLGGNDLSGTIPPEIGNLTELIYLDLSADRSILYGDKRPLFGVIPAGLFNLSKLEFLDLTSNEFEQDNTELMGNLTNLKSLAFSPFWAIPNGIVNLNKLETLYIQYLFMRFPYKPDLSIGAIPTFLGNMISLKKLHIDGIGVTGNIPTELGNLANLESLVIQRNLGLYGNIPGEFGNLTKLKSLTIQGIQNAGNIPPQLGNLINLENLDLSENQLEGSIPAEFNQLTNLVSGNLDKNNLSGPTPDLSNIKGKALSIFMNKYTFTGIEGKADRFSNYLNQAKLPIFNSAGVLSVDAGGTLSNNTYKWYRNLILVTTNVGNNSYTPTLSGSYQVHVTNSTVPNLILVSNEILDPLPVTLISFTGKNEVNKNQLIWKTASETNNSGFDIERSADAKVYENIGFIDGSGNSKENKIYQFTDQNPFPISYYRLKQIDYDGKFEYSKIISVKQNHSEVSIYPNPAGNQFFIKNLEKEKSIIIRNGAGQIMMNQKAFPKQPVDISNVVNGLYLITVGDETRKVVIQK